MKHRSLKVLSVLLLVVAVFLGTRELYNKKEQKTVGEKMLVSKAPIGVRSTTTTRTPTSTKIHITMSGFTAGFADENKQNQ